MNSLTTAQFWKLYNVLSARVKRRADKAYELWQINRKPQDFISSVLANACQFTLFELTEDIAH